MRCVAIRDRQGGCAAGQAVITTAGNLPATYVIHTVGPVWQGGDRGEDELLADCYRNSLQLAVDHGVRTIAITNISTGIYRFPKERAARIAVQTGRQYTAPHYVESLMLECLLPSIGPVRGGCNVGPADVSTRIYYHGTAELRRSRHRSH